MSHHPCEVFLQTIKPAETLFKTTRTFSNSHEDDEETTGALLALIAAISAGKSHDSYDDISLKQISRRRFPNTLTPARKHGLQADSSDHLTSLPHSSIMRMGGA
jgi:hypothetical protein